MQVPPLPSHDYHWVVPHHNTKLDPTTTLEALDLFARFEGEKIGSNKDRARVEINKGLGSLLSEDKRAGIPDPFRDYQQLYTHLGLIYPHNLVNGKLSLTYIGSELNKERIGLPEFLFLQGFGYQYPGGASEPAKTRTYLNNKILVKPILLIYQVLVELQNRGEQHAYIRQDEITTFIEPQRNNKNIEAIVSSILEARKPEFGSNIKLPYEYPTDNHNIFEERKRAVREFILLLEFLPFFEVFPDTARSRKRIRFNIPENQSAGLPEVQILANIEVNPGTFFVFENGNSSERLKWYEYFSGPERRQRWYAHATSLGKAQAEPPKINLREFSQIQEVNPIIITPAKVQRTPEETAILKERRQNSHEQIIRELVSRILQVGGKASYDPHSIDIVANIETIRYIFEVKSLADDQSDTIEQVRDAVGQLLEYQYRIGTNPPDTHHLYVVLDCYPETESWLIQYLNNHLHMGICWWDNNIKRFVFPNKPPNDLHFLTET